MKADILLDKNKIILDFKNKTELEFFVNVLDDAGYKIKNEEKGI